MAVLHRPQSGIYAEPSLHGLFVFMHIDSDDVAGVRACLASLPEHIKHWQGYFSEALLSVVVGIGEAYWDVLSPDSRPDGLHGVPDFTRSEHPCPATPYDFVLIVRSDRVDANYATARALQEVLTGVAVLAQETVSFRYLDGRDWLGFKVNPDMPHGGQRRELALVRSDDDPEFEDGSFLWIQQSRAEVARFSRLTNAEQERLMGRERSSGQRLKTAKQSHAEKNLGEVWSQRMLLTNLRHQGEIAFSFARSMNALQDWMTRRFLPDADGLCDPLLDYQQVEHNSVYFVPSERWLQGLTDLPTILDQNKRNDGD
ncbi:Dyp-type peroxidase [Aliidiomarina halalkaliphila]|uniref:Dyp-type peroxidase n=1 Tax=Aliidiomarina halalkaliphila TaxID=2593535 RepID=A0A552X5S8_9GAMM|nr:Dyp-type peroxidase [Aliidiomarina halalkaliphila]TRW50368.1 Dyp-type peroxidase [Aliidiomarina halalkaliphila]